MIAFAAICLLSVATGAQQQPAEGQGLPPEKILIVYLSRTNNTKAIADIIHEKVGGKLVALELQTPYPADYHATVQQVVRENETGYLPPLKTVIDGPDQYDFVFVGFPTWDMKLPPPMKSFLRQYSFRGKTIIPFNSNGGYGPGSTFRPCGNCARKAVCCRASLLGEDRKEMDSFLPSRMPGQKKSARK
jgi:flavodoxin